MRTLLKNKQKMKYALPTGEEPIINYYEDEDGTKYPLETGESEMVYEKPVEFMNGISGKLSEILVEAFGINDTSLYAQMDYMAHEFPFKTGTLIWKNSEVGYKNPEKTKPDKTTADYEICGILDEYPNQWSCLLKRILK